MFDRREWLASVSLLPLASLATSRDATKGVFVAVGYGGRRLVSTDGKNWEIAQEWSEKGGDDSDNLIGLTYGQGKFVAVGGGSPKKDNKAVGGHILVSKDGREWKEVHTAKFRVHPVLFESDRFVAGGPNRNFLFSLDGETWKEGGKLTAKEATHFRHGEFGNERFVFIGNHGGDSPETWVAVTRDGETIDHIAVDLPRTRGLAFGTGRFVAVGPAGMRMSSKDGRIWEKADPVEGEEFTWIVFGGDRFICGGGKSAFVSTDGVKWEKLADRIPCHLMWTDGTRGVGTSWPGQMWHSDDLKKWEKSKTMTPNGINRVVYASKG